MGDENDLLAQFREIRHLTRLVR